MSEEDKILRGGPPTEIDDVLLYTELYQAFQKWGDSKFAIDEGTGITYSYNQVFDNSRSVAIELKNRGLNNDFTVAVATSKVTLNSIYVSFGAWFAGVKLNPFHPIITHDGAVALLNTVKPDMIYIEEAHIELIDNAAKCLSYKPIIVTCKPKPSHVDFQSFLIHNPDSFQMEFDTNIDYIHSILMTSGTTGSPKGIKFRERALKYITANSFLFTMRENIQLIQPMYWVSSVMLLTISVLKGSTLILPKDSNNHEELLSLIDKYKQKEWFSSHTVLMSFMLHPNRHKYDISSIKSVFCGGSLLMGDSKRKINQELFGNRLHVIHLYGSTEMGILTKPYEEVDTTGPEYDTVGAINDGVELKIIDVSTGEALGSYEEGEICVKSVMSMAGFVNNSKVSEIDEDGWFHTGDIGYYDKKKLLYICSRIKDVMRYDGYQMTPFEIESVLQKHPEVFECCVVSKYDEKHGDLPAAFVSLKGKSNITEQDLIDFVAKQVVDYKQLRGGVYFVESIPKNEVGKILRKEVQKLIPS